MMQSSQVSLVGTHGGLEVPEEKLQLLMQSCTEQRLQVLNPKSWSDAFDALALNPKP